MAGAVVGGRPANQWFAGPTHRLYAALLALCLHATAHAQPTLFPAHWILHPTATARDYAVFHFRRTISASPTPPASLPVLVSADNRYKLYVNGELVSLGPTRGDLLHYRYERVDLGPYLHAGENIIAATVWNMGQHMPAAQVSLETAFWLQTIDADGEPLPEHPLNTDGDWEVHHDQAYRPELNAEVAGRTYAVVGPTDVVGAAKYPWGWRTGEDAASWVLAKAGPPGKGYGAGTDGGRYLVPSEQVPQRMDAMTWGRVRRVTTDAPASPYELDTAADGTLERLSVMPNTEVRVLLDHGVLATGYPSLVSDGGRGATVEVTYAEALRDADGQKGHRDSTRGRRVVGFTDRYLLDGGEDRRFEPLWWRTWRYVELYITTGVEPVTLNVAARRTGYPLEQTATITVDDPALDSIWAVGWRTQERCAHETFVDCPYYEQLQYVGDTRIQALVTLSNTGDATLMRRAILDFDQSRISSGLTQSRYPSNRLQVIPPYSLAWVAMVYDYHMHVDDEAFVRERLDGVEAVLRWHERQLNARGLMGRTPWWDFVDWTEDWPWDSDERTGGVPPQLADGSSAVLTGQYAYTLGLSAKLYATLGRDAAAERYRARAIELLRNLRATWKPGTGLIPDAPGLDVYSQHAQTMYLLAGLTLGDALPEEIGLPDVEQSVLRDGITATTLYYDFYRFEALRLAGEGDRYLPLLQPWRAQLALGLSTFAEKPEPTRSDCHAWSASPSYHLLSLVAGVQSGGPGFEPVVIRPQLGELQALEAVVAHPKGEVRVRYRRVGDGGLEAEVRLPAGVEGVMEWGGKERAVRGDTLTSLHFGIADH